MDARNDKMLKQSLAQYHIDFDTGMGKGTGYFRQIEKYTDRNKTHFDYFKNLYSRNNLMNVTPQEDPKIPKIIHQIWIGNREIPKQLKKYQKSWIEKHPTWDYKLWTNQDLESYVFRRKDLERLFLGPLTLGERVDILRYDILYQYGGIYADLDCVCLKPFEIFSHRYDFMVGISHPMFARQQPAIVLQNCLIATKPEHPIMARLAELLTESWDTVKYPGDEIYTTLIRTFFSITLAFIEEADKDGNIDIAMPPSYFFPLIPYSLIDVVIRNPLEVLLGLFLKDFAPYSFIRENSFSNHYSSKEWMKGIYSTLSFKHSAWIALGLKDWLLFFREKFLDKKSQMPAYRQTLAEFLTQ